MLVACVVALASGAVSVSAAPVGPRVLFATGQEAADGVGLESIEGPAARTAGDVAFVGATSAVLARALDGTVRVVARTGGPLPAPLSGTFNAISDPALNASGMIAFGATLNAATPAAVFLDDGGGLRPVITDTAPTRLALNGHGDLAYARGQALFVWRRATGEVVPLPPLRAPVTVVARPRLRGPIAFSDDGLVAFAVEERGRRGSAGGVFVWEPSTGIRAVVRQGNVVGGLTVLRDDRFVVAMNGAGTIAFTADVTGGVAVIRHVPATGETSLVAHDGDAVGAEHLTAIARPFVAVDADGTIVFSARTESVGT